MSNLKNYQIKAIAKKIYAEHQEELKKGQPSLNDAYIALREDKAFRTLLETFAKVVNTFKKSFEMKKEQLEEMGFLIKGTSYGSPIINIVDDILSGKSLDDVIYVSPKIPCSPNLSDIEEMVIIADMKEMDVNNIIETVKSQLLKDD